uniref:Bet v I/Major latex protein domain-containing protein n=1 Tax=Chenopodium quinoa TaxID=63459 RepID=A0A803NDP6_CHEQI
MAQLQRVEGQPVLKCHADKFFDIWSSKAHLIPKISPHKVANVELVEGSGIRRSWNNTVINFEGINCISKYDNGKPTLISGKTRAEELDFENRTYIFDVIDGHAREKYYKTFKGKMEVTPKGEGCIMKLSLEVEKLNEDAPEPNEHIVARIQLLAGDSHLWAIAGLVAYLRTHLRSVGFTPSTLSYC